MQHAALSGYCSAPLKLVPIDGVKQSVVDYPFLDLDCVKIMGDKEGVSLVAFSHTQWGNTNKGGC